VLIHRLGRGSGATALFNDIGNVRFSANSGPALWSDDECVRRLAALIEVRDNGDLSKIASLIGPFP
jgi:hypothetical protein